MQDMAVYMKFYAYFLIFMCCFILAGTRSNKAQAQVCNHPLGLAKNTEFIYQVTHKGKKKGTLTNKVVQQGLNGDSVFITTIKRTRITEKNRPETAEEFFIKCQNDTVYIDAIVLMQERALKAFDGKEVTYTSTDLAYPHQMQVGQLLQDGRLIAKVNSRMASISHLEMAAVNRKVADQLTVKTPAGDFECFRLTYQYVVKLDALGIVTENVYNVEEFFSPVHGIINVQFTTLKGKKSKGMELLSKKNPVQALQN